MTEEELKEMMALLEAAGCEMTRDWCLSYGACHMNEEEILNQLEAAT